MGTSSPLSSPPTSDGSPAVPPDKSRPIVRSSRGPPVVLVPPPSVPTGEEISPPGAKAAEESQGGLQPESEAASAAFEGKAVDASAGAVNYICPGEQAAIPFGDANPTIADVSPAGNVPDPAPLELDGQIDVVMDESHTSAAGPSPPTLPTDSSVPNLEAALLPPNELEPAASSFTEIDPYAHLESPPSIATGTAADKSDDLQIDRVNEVAMEDSELVGQLEPSRTPIEAATPKSKPGGEYNDLLAGLDDADFDFQLSSPMKPEASSLSFPESGPDDDDDDRIIPSSQEDERPLTMLSFATANRSAASQDLDEQTPLAKRRKLATDGREIARPPPPTFNLGMTTSVAGASAAQGDGRRFTRVDSKKLMPPPNSKPSRSISPDSFDAPSSSSSSSILPSSSLDLANQPFKGVFSTGMGKTFKAPSKTALLAAAKLMEVDPSDMDFDDLFSDGNDFSGFGRVETPQPKASSQTLRPRSVPAPAQKTTVASQAPSSKEEAAAAAGSPLTPQLSCTTSINDAPLPPLPVSQHPSQTKTTPAAVASTPHPPLAPILLSSSTPRRPVSQFSDAAIRPPPFRALSFSSASRPSQPSPSGSGSSSIANGTPSRTKSTAPRTGLASTPLRTPLLSRSNTPSGSSSSTAPSAATAAPTATPLRRIGVGNLGMTPRGRGGGGGPGSGRKKFSTPFKGGVKPPVDDDGRVVSATTATPGSSTRLAAGVTGPQQHLPPRSAMMSSVKGKERETPRYDKVFDLTPPGKRVSMRDSFVRPEFYSISELRDMLIPEEIWQINPQNAHLFSFVHPTDPSISLGPELALATLVDAGCQGLTRTWVDNHWALILWKLASLVRSKPAWYMENTWNWEATIRQLKYRYEREHNLGHRSAVKRIQEGDTAPGSSMILCVTAITMIPVEAPFAVNSAGGPGGGGEDVPTLELTDGWYRIRSAIDTVLSRAVARGKLRVGCKIAIFGARLEGEPGSPVLRAYEKTTLVLSGNSTSLARWDAKLGLQAIPFVAGLSSLSPEGGVVPRMDIVVERCFPLGWIDTPAEVAGGPPAGKTEPSKESVGAGGPGTAAEPSIRRGEKEELIEREKWAENHDAVKSSLLESIERRLELLLSLAERVERMASSSSLTEAAASFDPDDIIDIVLGLPTSAAQTDDLRGRALSMAQLKQLASTVKERYREDQAGIETEIEREMAIRCPPRESRSFRLIWFRDFHQRPSLVGSTTSDAKLPRRGQLTLWDAAGGEDGLDGGFGGMDGVGGLVEGKRYIVSNLTPGQRSSWSPAGMSGGEVYLNTRRDSRWRCIG